MTDQELKNMIKTEVETKHMNKSIKFVSMDTVEMYKYFLCKFIKMAKEHKEKRESQ